MTSELLSVLVDDVYEPPTDAELVVDTTKQSIPEIVHCEGFPFRHRPCTRSITY